MADPERPRIEIPELAEQAGVDEDDVADVLDALVDEGWLKKEYVVFNVRSSGDLDLPD